MVYVDTDEKLLQHLTKNFNPAKAKLLNYILATESIDYDIFFYLKYEHLVDMKLSLGDIFKL